MILTCHLEKFVGKYHKRQLDEWKMITTVD